MRNSVEESKDRCSNLEAHLANNKERFDNQVLEWKLRYDSAMIHNKSLQSQLTEQRKYNNDQTTRFMEIEINRQAKVATAIKEQYQIGKDGQLPFSIFALSQNEDKDAQTEVHASMGDNHQSVDEKESEAQEQPSNSEVVVDKSSNQEVTVVFTSVSTYDKSHDDDDDDASVATVSTATSAGNASQTDEEESLISAMNEPDAWFWAWTMPKEE